MNRSKGLLGFVALFLIAFAWHATGGTAPGRGGAAVSAGDSNGDGKVDISDAVHTLSYLFSGGPAPAACQSLGGTATEINFDPTSSSLNAINVQAALLELDQKLQAFGANSSNLTRRVTALEGEVDIELVQIPAGTFIMGSPPSELSRSPDETQHEVTISKPFLMGAKEITQAQFRSVMGWNPSVFAGCPDCPVDSVNWHDAVEFCNRLTERQRAEGTIDDQHSYRLPTESEWEYACRAGTSTRFYFGDVLSCNVQLAEFCPEASPNAWYAGNNSPVSSGPKPVGKKTPNAWGLYDMCGNIYEWCLDAYGPYPVGEVTDPTGPAGGEMRILRGGYWREGLYWGRSAFRYKFSSWAREGSGVFGFRIALVSEE